MRETIVEFITNSWASVASILAVVAVSLFLFAIAKRGLNLMLKKGKLAAPLATTLQLLLRWTFIIVAVLLILQQAGVLENVWSAVLTIVAAIAIGFVAGWSILSNVFCTLLILIYRPFRIGDQVDVPGEAVKGEVVDINFMFTTLKSDGNLLTQIPNNIFFMKPILRSPGEVEVPLYEQLKSDKPFDK
ncbi:MAG: mechanosensitive ion channel [Deltaproteobacteria bacterium]|nr:mechanosensitive ion channel [Deltaproteobacteria bacterium]